MNKTVFIISGVSGSGKSTLAKRLEEKYAASSYLSFVAVCCADDFFTDRDGNYKFNPELLGAAHAYCKAKFEESLRNPSCNCVIVANTNTRKKDRQSYIDLALEAGVDLKNIFSIAVENHHESDDVHNVPNEAKDRQRNQLKNSFRF